MTLRIEHSLLAVPGATLDTIKYVYSHPHGFPQCKKFLDAHPAWTHVDALSTATAAGIVAEKQSVENAAIASGVTASYYKLNVLESGIESDPRNYTRFVIITANHLVGTDKDISFSSSTGGAALAEKASIVFASKNEPGALYECLGVFHDRKLNLTRLESRPIQGQPWRYMFYVDVMLPESASGDDSPGQILQDAVEALKNTAEDVRILGIYQERSL